MAGLTLPDNCTPARNGATVTVSCVFGYSGGEQTFSVPAGISSLSATAVGAPGGTSEYGGAPAAAHGGIATAVLSVSPGATLYVEVGGPGGAGQDGSQTSGGAGGAGGFNGGGPGGAGGTDDNGGGGGGGASDVRTVPMASSGSLTSRLLVAAGGGGADGYIHAGGAAGQPGSATYYNTQGGQPGSATAGGAGGSSSYEPGSAGSLGVGGSGANGGGSDGGGGGGGGLYGGGGGSVLAGGGGGSSSGATTGIAPTTTPSVTLAFTLPAAPTQSGLSCTPNALTYGSGSTTCTATVTDTSATPVAPSGPITLTTSGSGAFSPTSGACTLAPVAGSTSTASCTVSYTPASAGTDTLTASYGGDLTHTPSSSAPLQLPISPLPAAVSLNLPVAYVYTGSAPAIAPSVDPTTCGPVTLSYQQGSGPPTSTVPADAGSYTVQASLGNANCQIASGGSGTLIIAQAAQALTFTSTPPSSASVGTTYAVAATGGASGNPVTFSAGPSSVCTASGTNGATISFVGAGTCTVTASQAGDQDYQAAPEVTQTVTVLAPLALDLALSSSPAGPVTTGSVVTLTDTLTNNTALTQTVRLTDTLSYTSPRGHLTMATIHATVTLAPGQTLGHPVHFSIPWWFPRGAYTLAVQATDGSGDTASGAVALTVT